MTWRLKQAPQALFVDTEHPEAIYPRLLGADRCWGVERDARGYTGPDPVVAHPPCHLCGACAGTGRREPNRAAGLPAWYTGGDDSGCFASALASVRRFGGVLEHPAGSHAWAEHDIDEPHEHPGWYYNLGPHDGPEWICEVWQSAYGHTARKRTWLLYCGSRPPFELDWTRKPGTHQVGWFDRNKPTVSKREASATPRAFAEVLIRLAEWSRGE